MCCVAFRPGHEGGTQGRLGCYGFRVYGFGVWVEGLEFRDYGSGLRTFEIAEVFSGGFTRCLNSSLSLWRFVGLV